MSRDNEMKNLLKDEDQNNTAESLERRDALKKIGKFAAYGPPTMLTLLLSKRATAVSPPHPPGG